MPGACSRLFLYEFNGNLMNLPCFYTESIAEKGEIITLDEDSSRHILQVLRFKIGGQVQLTDGKGNQLTAEIVDEHKKSARVHVLSSVRQLPQDRKIAIAISLIKNSSRFEWFLEKATEIGVHEIIPLICERTEKQHFRPGRMKNILVSAMLQSRQSWLPHLQKPLFFADILEQFLPYQRLIAHCADDEKNDFTALADQQKDAIVLIGPEGDFTTKEIELALQFSYLPVRLGDNRLRTETAGVVAATLLKFIGSPQGAEAP